MVTKLRRQCKALVPCKGMQFARARRCRREAAHGTDWCGTHQPGRAEQRERERAAAQSARISTMMARNSAQQQVDHIEAHVIEWALKLADTKAPLLMSEAEQVLRAQCALLRGAYQRLQSTRGTDK
jgi:hypothetical protein